MYQHHEIAIKNKEKALEVLSALVDEEYCVMFSLWKNGWLCYNNKNERRSCG